MLEDAHWIDPSTTDFVGELMPRISDHRILLLISYRPDNAPTWVGRGSPTVITLNRLGRRQAAELAQSVGGTELMHALIERIVKRADGVPLFIEELTKSVLESYANEDDRSADSLIPETLQSSLVARLDRLEDAKEIAQTGSVIGREFSIDLLCAVSERSRESVTDALQRLMHAGLILRHGTTNETTYTFKHALLQDAAYATILMTRRRELHRKILDALEQRPERSMKERVGVLARHAVNGEVWDKASAYLQLAGVNAMDRAAVREAITHFSGALAAGESLPMTREAMQAAIDLRLELRNALWSIGEFGEILTHLNDARALASDLDDPRRSGWLLVFESASLWQLGRASDAIDAATQALEFNKTAADLPLAVGANFYLGCAYVTSGDSTRAERLFGEIVDMVDGDLSHDRAGLPFVPAVVARSWLVWSLAERGAFAEGEKLGQRALQIAEEVGHPFNLAHIYYDLGYFHDVQGNYEKSIETLETADFYVQEWRLTYLSPFIVGFLGHAYAFSGDSAQGCALLRRAVADYERMGLGLFRSLVTVHLGDALLLNNEADEALEVAQEALQLSRRRNERGHEAYALRLLGECALDPGHLNPDSARQQLDSALACAQELGLEPLAAHCHLSLGRAALIAGDVQAATDLFTKALDRYRRLDMPHWELRAGLLRDGSPARSFGLDFDNH